MVVKVSEFRVWTSLAARKDDLRITAGDIQEAISDMRNITGQTPSLIILNPRNDRFTDEVPEGMEIIFQKYIHLWEMWFAWDGHTEPCHSAPAVAETASRPKRVMYHQSEATEGKIKEYLSQNLSTRAIRDLLRSQGVTLSHMTIERRRQKVAVT